MALPAVPVSQSPEAKFREYLASRRPPQRFTEQQRDLVRYIFSQHEHFDAEQLIDDTKRAGFQISRATIYRTLVKLVDAGLLRRLEVGPRRDSGAGGSRVYYEHDYGYPQHEHLQCAECGKMIEFQCPDVESTIAAVCRQHHFKASGHTFIIRGICAECNRARVTKRMLDLV